MSLLLYNIFLWLYSLGIRIASLFNPKAAKWINGRNNWKNKLAEIIIPGQKYIWVHCSSLGEYEQGKPLIQELKDKYPGYQVIITFFSPSGYEAYIKQNGSKDVMYLPMDGRKNAKYFIDQLNPALAIFVKYEFWYYYLHTLKTKSIPTILVSAAFRKEQTFFKWYGGFFTNILHCFNLIFVQDPFSFELLKTINLNDRTIMAGDTRYDRVAAIAQNFVEIPCIQQFKSGKKLLIAGSTWKGDEHILSQNLDALPGDWKLVIAPHEVKTENINRLKQLFANDAILYSELVKQPEEADYKILIIDNIGMLSRLYAYGEIALVGGGFDKGGVHNVLEPAAFGLPVMMGTVYHKYVEAIEMVENGLAFPVKDTRHFKITLLQLISDEPGRLKLKSAITSFIQSHTGSTNKIMLQIIAGKWL